MVTDLCDLQYPVPALAFLVAQGDLIQIKAIAFLPR
jgi:hypothetical protein